ncbi:MAG: class I SAM-dependent methyltransferase [Pseudomonadota bacterium]
MIRPSLTDLSNRFGSDKGTIGPSARWGGNNYTDVYEGFFQPLRDRPVHVLEIGLGVRGAHWEAHIAHGRNAEGGGSIKALHAYFERGQIYGVDINPATHLENERLRTFQLDQGDRTAWSGFLQEVGEVAFDVIIDDGSHRPDHQQITLEMLLPRLAPGGIFVIEDLMDNGRGDGGAESRHSAEQVLSTRRLLKGFLANGVFPAPHAFRTPEAVADHIASVSFHVPEAGLSPLEALRRTAIDTLRGRPMRLGRKIRYLPDSEHVAVICKHR